MLRLKDYIAAIPENTQIRFEYCYLDENMNPYVEKDFSYSGRAGDFAGTMEERSPMVLNLYASCKEANDFESFEEDGIRVIKYIDFR